MSVKQKFKPLRTPPRRKRPSQVVVKQKKVRGGILIGNKFNREVNKDV